jgi:hypothetical protein
MEGSNLPPVAVETRPDDEGLVSDFPIEFTSFIVLPLIAVVFTIATSIWFPVRAISGHEDLPLANVPIDNYTVKTTVSGLSTQSRDLKILLQFNDFTELNGSLRIRGRVELFAVHPVDPRVLTGIFASDFARPPPSKSTSPLLLYHTNSLFTDRLSTTIFLQHSSWASIGSLTVIWQLEDPRASYFSSAIRLT